MKNAKRIAAILAAALLTASIASCGSGSGSSSVPSSDTSKENSSSTVSADTSESTPAASGDTLEACKMTIWLAGTGESVYNEVYNNIVTNWENERAPGSTHELSFISWSDYFSKLSTGLAGGAAPDVYMTGYGQMGSMNAQGYELNLSDYFPEDWDGYTDIPENLLSAGMVDGDIYGLLEPATRILMYRKDIAEQNGVTEDDLTLDSLDDLTNLVEKMCVYDDNGNLMMAGLDVQTGTYSSEQPMTIIGSNFTDKYELWDKNSKATFNNEASIKTIEYLKGLFDAGYCFPSDPSNTTAGVISGLSSMSITPESSYAQANMAFPDQIGIVEMSLNTMLIGNFIVANADTPNPVQAADLVQYMFNEESLKEKAKLGQYTMRTSLDDWYLETYPEFTNVVKAYVNSYAMASTLNANYTECVKVLRNHYETAMNGIESIPDALAAAESEWNAIVEG